MFAVTPDDAMFQKGTIKVESVVFPAIRLRFQVSIEGMGRRRIWGVLSCFPVRKE